ncbi:MAG: polyprenyl synthetase family protein, partial [Promethearchaeota archaeon]
MTDVIRVLGKIGRRVDAEMLKLLKVGAAKDFYEVVFHQVKAGGKRLRPAMTLSFCEASGGSQKDALSAAAAIELVHNYSLILDDIIDDADVRRNLPTTWKKFGLSLGILASTHYREAIEEGVLRSPNPTAVAALVAEAIRDIVEGERLDVLFEQVEHGVQYVDKHRYEKVTIKDYEKMIGKKTAALIRAACEVGVVCAGGSDKLRQAARDFGWKGGLAFQMADDMLDLFAEAEKLGKRVGKDIYEHKLGNVVILYSLELLAKADCEFLLKVLRAKKPRDRDVVKVIEMLHGCGATERVQKRAKKLVDEAKRAL